nr:hypothetical protein [Moraxella osloensis]
MTKLQSKNQFIYWFYALVAHIIIFGLIYWYISHHSTNSTRNFKSGESIPTKPLLASKPTVASNTIIIASVAASQPKAVKVASADPKNVASITPSTSKDKLTLNTQKAQTLKTVINPTEQILTQRDGKPTASVTQPSSNKEVQTLVKEIEQDNTKLSELIDQVKQHNQKTIDEQISSVEGGNASAP